MSTEPEDTLDSKDPSMAEATAEGDLLDAGEGVPTAFSEPPLRSKTEGDNDSFSDELAGRAVAAAREAISVGESALQQAEDASELLAKAEAAEASKRSMSMRDRVMAGLLLFNIALLGLIVAMPGNIRQQPAGPVKSGKARPGIKTKPDSYVPDITKLEDRFPNDGLYEDAALAARRGDYPKAVDLLKRLLRAKPDMGDVQLRLVYGQLAYNLLRDGREKEAAEYADRIDRMRLQTTLPEDLVRAARRAEKDGRGNDMRRYYARFLLQQNQVRPDMREVIAEAYLKIGDSYRLNAERGEQQAKSSKSEASK